MSMINVDFWKHLKLLQLLKFLKYSNINILFKIGGFHDFDFNLQSQGFYKTAIASY